MTPAPAASCSCSGPDRSSKAPHGFIAPFRAPEDVAARARLQRDLVAAFPNVSVIDLREVPRHRRALIRSLTLGVTIVGGLVALHGRADPRRGRGDDAVPPHA